MQSPFLGMWSRVLLGMILGAVLGLGRSHSGFDLLSMPAVPAQTAAYARAVTLVLVGAGILLARGLFPAKRAPGELLVGATLGFAGTGLGLGWPRVPAPWWLVLLALVGCAALGRRRRSGAESTDQEPPALNRPGYGGLALGAAGVTLCLDGLMRGLSARGGGLPADDAVFGTVLLVAMTLGGAVLSSAAGGVRRPDSIPAICALTAAASFIGMLSFAGLAPKLGLGASLERIGLKITAEGTLLADAWIATLVLLAPALACGAALFGARRAAELATLAFGAAAGVAAAPALMRADPARLDLAPGAMRLILVGAGVASAGAALAALTVRGRTFSFARVAGALAVILCGALAFQFKDNHLEVELVRGLRPIRPLLVCELPEGQLQVDPRLEDAQLVMLGKRAIAPDAEHARVDDLCLSTAFEFLSEGTLRHRVLLIGQLTPRRARVLTENGAQRIDRSAAWWRAMPGVEALLFDSAQGPPGEILSPQAARSQIAGRAYDLVIVAPVQGSAPRIPREVELPHGTLAVAWIDAAADDLAQRVIERPVALVLDGLEQPNVGLIWGRMVRAGRAPGRTPLLPAGDPLAEASSTVERLGLEPWKRADRNRVEWMLRLEAASRTTVFDTFSEGLRRHAAAQTGSSPFETREQRVEIDEEALHQLFLSCMESEPDATLREVWNGACRVLRAKRDVTSMYRFLEPIESTWGPWPEMIVALAECDLEELEYEDALARLTAIVTDETTDFDQLATLARALDEAEDYADAAALWRRALVQRPADLLAERHFGISLIKSGNPEGRPILERILAHDPADSTVRELLGLPPEPLDGPGEHH